MNNYTDQTKRAWVEIDLSAVAHNANKIKSHLPAGCEMISVIKTNAYGHGINRVALRLQESGVKAFAVATIDEAVGLRETGITGNILVLGYTPSFCAGLLSEHNIEQLIVDYEHAKVLNETGYKIDVHIAIDSGMHRLGFDAKNLCEIESVFSLSNLRIAGTASHLASQDCLSGNDIDFTEKQIETFYDVVNSLKAKGYNPGKLHVQASYGICNYPDLKCDYARAGIISYGVMSDNEKTKTKPDLRPVLSLHARIIQVRTIEAGEQVSYGRIFTADKRMKMAVVSIGYADGIPRQLSGKGGYVLVNGSKAPIIGRVCMDLMMIDVSYIDDVKAGDIATLIGKSGSEVIRCEDFAERAGTISNEILSRLATRLNRVYKD